MVCNGGDISSMSDREPDTFLLEETSLWRKNSLRIYLSPFPFYLRKAKRKPLFLEIQQDFFSFYLHSYSCFRPLVPFLFDLISLPSLPSLYFAYEKGTVMPFDDHYNNVKLEKRCTFKLYGAYSNIIEKY